MKVLFATTNPSKIRIYAEALKKRGIEVLTIKDLGININIDENGKNAIENACIKAKAYYEIAKIPTISMDNNLYIEEFDEDNQPGTYVRRINGKEMNYEEMFEYYLNLVKENGGKLTARWVYGMAIYNGREFKNYTWSKDKFYLIDKPAEKIHLGYPLDAISIQPELNKYFVDLTEEDKVKIGYNKNMEDVINFIINNINL